VGPLVVLLATPDAKVMLIQVIDNGPGVNDTDRIFDAFMTTKRKRHGYRPDRVTHYRWGPWGPALGWE